MVLFYGLCAKWLFVLWKICDVLWECELMCVGLLRSCDLYIEWLAFDLWLMVVRTFLYMSYRRVCRMRCGRTWLVCEFNLIVTPIWTFWLCIQLTKTKFNFVVSSNKQITFFTIICFYLFFFYFVSYELVINWHNMFNIDIFYLVKVLVECLCTYYVNHVIKIIS